MRLLVFSGASNQNLTRGLSDWLCDCQLKTPAAGESLNVDATSRPISMSTPGHEQPHSHEVEGLKARGLLPDHVEKLYEVQHDAVESIVALKAEIDARDPHSAAPKLYSTPIPFGHDGRQGSLKQSDSLQAKVPLERGTHDRDDLRQQLVRHHHEVTEGTVGQQHYAGHPQPYDGAASQIAEVEGRRGKRVDANYKQVGLTHRPDTTEGMARRTDHVDLIASVHSEPTIRRQSASGRNK